MADVQLRHAATGETIPSIFVRFLKATSDDERQAVVQAHPSLFPDAVIDALAEARVQFNATMREVREACRMIDAVSGGLEYTGTSVELQPAEAKALLDEDTLLQNFATSLAALLDAREKQGRLVQPSPSAAVAAAAAASHIPAPSFSSAPSHSPSTQRGPWFAQPALVMAVLAFLPAETIFMEAESVCRSWQAWLFEPEVSRFFWVGCVQREFPQQLQTLLQTEGEDLFLSDWRSLAMLCVAETEERSAGGEAAEERA